MAHLHKKPVVVDRSAEGIDTENVLAAVVVYIRALEETFQPCFGAFVVVVKGGADQYGTLGVIV